ncbi:hypothetical protein K492DRAFT_138981, partial [Lichtheimia hyalospora FSU 10163]
SLQQIIEAYNNKFGTMLAGSTLHDCLVHSMRITLKRAGKYPERRTNNETKQTRADFVHQHINDGNLDCQSNYVFINTASFNASMRRNYAWSEVGKPAHVQVPILRAPSTTLLAAINNFGLIEAAIKVCPKDMKRTKGTWRDDLSELIDNDHSNQHGWYLIFDNAPIHTPKFIQEEIEKRGYRMVLLPRYSPFLNPIEEFFKVKGVFRRDADDRDVPEDLELRICQAMAKCKLSDYEGWVRHSISFFTRCLS